MVVVVEYRCMQCHRKLFEADEAVKVPIRVICERCGSLNQISPRPPRPDRGP